MTPQLKISLVFAFILVLLLAMFITDQLSTAQNSRLAQLDGPGRPLRSGAIPLNLPPSGSGSSGRESAPGGGRSVGGAGGEEPAPGSERPIFDWAPPNYAARTADPGAPGQNGSITVPPESGESRGSGSTHQPEPEGRSSDPAADRSVNRPNGTPNGDRTRGGDSVRWHNVLKNETLYSIAKHYYGDGGLFDELGLYNIDRVPDDLRIREGVRLRIPDRSVLRAGRPARTAPPSATPRYTEYVVRKDDSLGGIAQRLLGSANRWQELHELNRDVIPDPDDLRVGDVLRIPISG